MRLDGLRFPVLAARGSASLKVDDARHGLALESDLVDAHEERELRLLQYMEHHTSRAGSLPPAQRERQAPRAARTRHRSVARRLPRRPRPVARVCGGGWAARLALGLEDGGDVLGRDGALQLLAVEQLGLDLIPRALALGEGLGALAVAPTKACRGTTQQVGPREAGTGPSATGTAGSCGGGGGGGGGHRW